MAKTRSQGLHSTVKKEECEDKLKLERLLHSTNDASGSITKNTRSTAFKTKVVISPRYINALVKLEDTDDRKLDLATTSLTTTTTLTRPAITEEQIANLIHYITNNKMSVYIAAEKAGMSSVNGFKYYKEYKNDPEHKIPLPKRISETKPKLTQKKIDDLIRYIVHGKLTIGQAANKVKMHKKTADKYYTKYLDDPEGNIPTLPTQPGGLIRRYTQEQINNLIRYIVQDEMNVTTASEKANIGYSAAIRYYTKYLNDPNRKIPSPGRPVLTLAKNCTNEQVKNLIHYIIDDKMTLSEASLKANMYLETARKYYQIYLNDPNHEIPTIESKAKSGPNKRLTLDQVKTFFNGLLVDKLDMYQATAKANMSECTGFILQKKYLKNPSKEVESIDISYSVEKMKKLIEYVEKDKMCFTSAAKKAHLTGSTARVYYRQYSNDPQHRIPVMTVKQYKQDDIRMLIGYIEKDKMSVSAASRKMKMGFHTAERYYKQYLNDPERNIPTPVHTGVEKRRKVFDQYSQIIADIYKNNPSIKPK